MRSIYRLFLLLLVPTKREDAFAHNHLEVSFLAPPTNESAVDPDCEQALGAEKVMFLDDSQADRDRLPIPDGPLSVGIDGGIVRARRGKSGEKTPSLFEVIAGKSILSFRRDDPEDAPPSSKCFALVRSFDEKPKRRTARRI